MKKYVVVKTALLFGAAAMSAAILVGCAKEDNASPVNVASEDDVVEIRAVGSRFINGTNGWDSFDVSNTAAELGEFEANIDNTGYVTIRTEGVGGVRVGDGGNYPAGVCDGPVPVQGGFRFAKASTNGVCGPTYYVTPRKSGNSGRCLRLRIKRGVLPALSAGQSWFTYNGSTDTWSAHASASTYFCWTTVAVAPTPLCE